MQPVTPCAKWYLHITELPLNRFIDCLVDGNINALVISGKPTGEDLMTAWVNIQAEYADAVGTNEYRLYVGILKEVLILGATMAQIDCLITLLEEFYHPEILSRLNKLLRTSFTLDPSDEEKYKATLKRFRMRSKGVKMDLDLKEIQLEGMKKKMEGTATKPDRAYYHSVLVTLSDYAKYHISDTLTVFEYCERLRRYTNYCEQAKLNKGGKR